MGGACIKQVAPIEPKMVKTRGVIQIYYGTTSGNSSRLAYSFADSAKQQGYHPFIINLSDFDPEQLRASPLNVFFISTYGSGGPSNDAEKFHDWLMSQERVPNFLQNQYVLFGLGNTNHEHFCGMAQKVDERFKMMGAQRIYDFGKGNSANETTDNDYMQWVQGGVFEAMNALFPVKNVLESQLKTQGSQFTYEFTNQLEPQQKDLQFMAQQYLSSVKYTIQNIYEMKKQPSLGNSTLFIDLKSDLQYKSAQNIAIYPENSIEDVLNICQMSNLNPNQIFKLTSKSKHAFPTPITIQDYLQKYCDFLGPVSRKQLYVLADLIKDEKEQELFRFASSYQGRQQFTDSFVKTKESVLSIVVKHKLKLDLLQIMELCPLISPRFFTIASSPKKFQNNIQLLCSQLVVRENRVGLCSKYLSQLKSGDQIRAYLIDSNFTYPQNKNAPIMLIGPGAGLAPMRAFIQDKDQYIEEDKLDESPFQGPMTLYFGCKTKDDYLCQKELEEYLSNGTLSALKVAVSREPNNIKYVTGFLSDDLKSLATFFDLGGVMYICGSQQMGKDVCNQIENMFKAVKKVAPYMAYKKVLELEKNKQLIKELWG